MNERFGKLTVTSDEEIDIAGVKYVYCDCDCGNKHFLVPIDDLFNGYRTDCFCSQFKLNPNYVNPSDVHSSQYKNGDSIRGSKYYRLHSIWLGMRRRCNPKYKNNQDYRLYAGRGIRVCDEWNEAENGYERFKDWSLKNGYNESLTIDRIDGDGNYTPQNCRWVTLLEQANNRRDNIIINYCGFNYSLPQWCRILGLSYNSVMNRKNYWKCNYKDALDSIRVGIKNHKEYNNYKVNGKKDGIIFFDSYKANDKSIEIR